MSFLGCSIALLFFLGSTLPGLGRIASRASSAIEYISGLSRHNDERTPDVSSNLKMAKLEQDKNDNKSFAVVETSSEVAKWVLDVGKTGVEIWMEGYLLGVPCFANEKTGDMEVPGVLSWVKPDKFYHKTS